MKLKDLAQKIHISLESLQSFIFDFGIDIHQAVNKNLDVTQHFSNFVESNKDFLQKYNEDHGKEKSISDIAKTLEISPKDILNFFKENGLSDINVEEFKTKVSSFLIHIYIGGNYDFIHENFPKNNLVNNKVLTGYTDVFFYLTDMLDPFINSEQLSHWGISRPAGIVLYGPPGSGKTFWAHKIADIIGYKFVHLYKDFLISKEGVHNSKTAFSQFLMRTINQPKTLLFIESFDELMEKPSTGSGLLPESLEVINTVIRHIQKNVHNEIVFVGSAEVLSKINEEIVAPGRFDLHIPVFPPREEERAELILSHMLVDLCETSPLLEILVKNNANSSDFWKPIASQMKLFSNTMIIDFTQSLKKRLYAIYRKDENKNIVLSDTLLLACYNESRSKLTKHYIQQCQIFIKESKLNVGSEFPHRILELEAELDLFTNKQEPIRKIGFKSEDQLTIAVEEVSKEDGKI